jgi:hypothetical protein
MLSNVQQFYSEGEGMPPRMQFVFKNVKISRILKIQNTKLIIIVELQLLIFCMNFTQNADACHLMC